MTNPRPVWLALLALLAIAAPACAQASGDESSADAQGLPAPDQTFVSGKDIVVYPPDRGTSAFRFLPDASYIPFDRRLVLSAAPGETRIYLLQVASGKGKPAEAPLVAYVVDKKRPAAPSAEPGTGLYQGAVAPILAGEEGADIFWAIVGPSGAVPSFAPYDELSRPRMAPPASGTASYTLIAFSVDPSGNRSYPSRFSYRLAEPGLPAAAPVPEPVAIAVDSSIPRPEIDAERGFSELRMSLPPGASLLVDVDPESPPLSLGDFERIEPEGAVAKLRLPCPYGWSGDLNVYFGIVRDGAASYNPQPIVVRLSNPAEELPLPASPEGPALAADPAGRGAFAIFPSYDGALYVSVDGATPEAYASPLALPSGKRSVRLSWFGEDDSGQRSPTRSLSLALPEALPDFELSGVADGAAIRGDATLKPFPVAKAEATAESRALAVAAAPPVLRYEMRLDGGIPPEPSAASPVMGDSLTIACPPGEERSVAIRYRAFSGDRGSEGRILRFSLDRKPPEVPRLKDLPTVYTDKAASIALQPGLGGKDIFAAVSADGSEAKFVQVTGPIDLPGSESGPVSYVVRAYDVDAAGNRSPEMKSISLVVDRSSVYAAEDGSERGDGSPDRPFRSLDAAIAAAVKAGKRSVNMRGAMELRQSAVLNSELGLIGGFGKLWARESGSRAALRVAVPQGKPAFSLRGGSLRLRGVDVSFESSGGSLVAVAGASLAIEDSSISSAADGDLVLVSADRSRIDVKDSRIKAARAMAFTAFSADNSDITFTGSSISADGGVRIFGAFDMDGGSLVLRESLLESRADLGLSMMALRSASVLVDRSLLKAEGGSGFLRLGSFQAVRGELRNSKVLLSWNGPGTLFEISGGGPAFRHDTIVAGSDKGGLRFFDARGLPPQVWNCILECSGPGSELLRTDTGLGAGYLVADCVWGFDRLLAGAREIRDLASLNAINAGSVIYSSRPIVSEGPERSFGAPLKSQAPLRAGSACVNAALPLESGYEVDFGGHPRPGGAGPDIGADELAG
jgi:hypothetical protein